MASNGELMATEHYEGPLPHPQILERYDEIVPGSAEAIVNDFKTNTQFIRDLTEREMLATINRDRRGQWMAYSLAIMTLGLAGYSLYLGHVWVAGGAFCTAIGTIVVAFLKRDNN